MHENFNPWDLEDMVEKILLVKNSPELRKELIQKKQWARFNVL